MDNRCCSINCCSLYIYSNHCSKIEGLYISTPQNTILSMFKIHLLSNVYSVVAFNFVSPTMQLQFETKASTGQVPISQNQRCYFIDVLVVLPVQDILGPIKLWELYVSGVYMLCTIVSDSQLNITVQSVGETTVMISWTDIVVWATYRSKM